jgi:LysR family transcriptional activator of glutamate synthase operon
MVLNLEFFEGFMEAAKHKSLSKASEKLNLTHPALSKQIRKLERYYGVTLFRRSATGVELTDAGKLLYERIRPILRDLAALQADLSEYGGLSRVALGALPSAAAHYLPPLIVELEKRGITADLVVKPTSEELIELVQAGPLYAAVVDNLSSRRSLWRKPLFTEPLYAVLPPQHPYYACESIDVKTLGREPLVLHPPACSIRACVTRLLEREQAEPWVRMEVGFGDFLLGYVAAGAGITVVPKLVGDHVSHLGLRAVPIADEEAKRTVSLIARSAAVGRAVLRGFGA